MKTKLTILSIACLSMCMTSCEDLPYVEDTVPYILTLATDEPEAEGCVVTCVVEDANFSRDRTSVYFQYSDTPDFEYADWLPAQTLNYHGFYYQIKGLEPGTKYYYRCRVQNNYDQDQKLISKTESFTTDTRYRQTIYWSQTETLYLGVDKLIKLTARSSSGLPVSYRVVEGGDCVEIEDYSLYVIANGTAVIEAYQDGNDMYYPASPVTKSFKINDNKLIISDVIVDNWGSTNGGNSQVGI